MLMQRVGMNIADMHSQAQDECTQICKVLASILMTAKGLHTNMARPQPAINS
jgi:hypothetical protein